MKIFEKEIVLKSDQCYLAEHYPENGFYVQKRNDSDYKDYVIVDKDANLVVSLLDNDAIIRQLEAKIKEKSKELVKDAVNDAVKKASEGYENVISSNVKDYEKRIEKLKKEHDRECNGLLRNFNDKEKKYLEDISGLKERPNEDFVLKLVSIVSGNDKYKELKK